MERSGGDGVLFFLKLGFGLFGTFEVALAMLNIFLFFATTTKFLKDPLETAHYLFWKKAHASR